MSNEVALTSERRSGGLVVAPQTFSEAMALADAMSQCSFVPKHLRGKPADCLAVCLQALRWEMDPFSVAQKTYFVQEGAAPGYEAQLINAVILSRAPLDGRPDIEWSGSGNELTCTVTGRFRGDPKPKTKTCRFASVTPKNSPLWKSDPEQQLAYFTTRAWARLYCPDILMGVYAPDEVAEIGPDLARDVTPEQPKAPDPILTMVSDYTETERAEEEPPLLASAVPAAPEVPPSPPAGNGAKFFLRTEDGDGVEFARSRRGAGEFVERLALWTKNMDQAGRAALIKANEQELGVIAKLDCPAAMTAAEWLQNTPVR